jgi:glucan phosphoethanolaminetransferase (alkaline phosphatase superfamily)
MKHFFLRYKWPSSSGVFALMTGLLICLVTLFEDKPWLGNALQTVCTIIGLYATVLIFLQSKEESDRQFREHLEHLRELNSREIEALYKATEKQIEAIQQSTLNQISAFEKQTNAIAEKLSDNSILLAEILGRD